MPCDSHTLDNRKVTGMDSSEYQITYVESRKVGCTKWAIYSMLGVS